MTKKLSQSININLKVVVSLGILVILATQVDFGTIINRLSEFDWRFALVALCIIFAQITFLNMRWHKLLNIGKTKIDKNTSAMINIAGFIASSFFFSIIGGLVTRTALVAKQGYSLTFAALISLVDRAYTFFALLFFGVLGCPLLLGIIDGKIVSIIFGMMILGILAAAMLYMMLQKGIFKRFLLANRKRAKFAVILRMLSANRMSLIQTAIYSITAQFLYFTSVFVLALGFGVQGNYLGFWLLLPAVSLVASLPISIGGWGVREGAFVYGLGLIGLPMEDSLLLSIQIGLITMIAPFLISIPYLFGYGGGNLLDYLRPKSRNEVL